MRGASGRHSAAPLTAGWAVQAAEIGASGLSVIVRISHPVAPFVGKRTSLPGGRVLGEKKYSIGGDGEVSPS